MYLCTKRHVICLLYFILFLLINVSCNLNFLLLCSPNEVWEHIVFTLFLTIIIKVFRLQRKTLLLFFGFFFPIIIKVFRFQRKTFLLFYCFFFSIIILFSYRFCTKHSSKTAQTILHEIFRTD